LDDLIGDIKEDSQW